MNTGVVFDIQHYSVYDGPGIRTVVFMKGCPLRCAWCQNPESQKTKPEIGYLTEKCTGCGECVEACPNGAIKQRRRQSDERSIDNKTSRLRKSSKDRKQPDSPAVNFIVRDALLCTACGRCTEVCETGAVQVIGRKMSAEDVAERVLLDKPFYDNSSGGVTFSGGEPTLQKAFLLNMLGILKEAGVHTAIETCGCFGKSLADELVPLTDLFLFDLKEIDPGKHRAFTGTDNAVILNNFTSILEKAGPARIIPRIPLIPGFNTDDASIVKIAEFLIRSGYNGEINLMPYNPFYKTKFEKIGRDCEYRDFGSLEENGIGCITGLFESSGIKTVCQR